MLSTHLECTEVKRKDKTHLALTGSILDLSCCGFVRSSLKQNQCNGSNPMIGYEGKLKSNQFETYCSFFSFFYEKA